MSSIDVYKSAVDQGALVVQDLAVFAAPWTPGVVAPVSLFDSSGLLQSAVTSLGLVSLGVIDAKNAASLAPDVKYAEIMGYGQKAPRRRLLQTEGMDIDIQPQEARLITHQIQHNLDAGKFTSTTTGGFRVKKTAGSPPKYWSLFFLGLDYNDTTGAEILPWWFLTKVGLDKVGKMQFQNDSTVMPQLSFKLYQDGNNLYEFGIDGAGWASLAPSLGFGTSKVVTVLGAPTGGTFTLSIGGQTTSGIPFNATSTAVASALGALSTVGSSHVTVSGSAGGPYTVSFDSTVTGTLTASGASLTGGTNPSVTVA